MTMLTTVKILIVGLTAIVPHGTQDGVTVLLRDALFSTPEVSMPSGGTCKVSLHVPLLLQLTGTCSGDGCLAVNELGGQALLSKFGVVDSGSGREITESTSAGSQLRWLLASESVTLREPGASSAAGHDFRYSFALHGTRVASHCLPANGSCPIVGSFHSPAGSLRPCPFVKDSQSDSPAAFDPAKLGTKDPVGLPGTPLAGSHLLEFQTQDATLTLEARDLSGTLPHRTATLHPEGNEITIAVLNLPLIRGSNVCDYDTRGDVGAVHLASLYDLAKQTPQAAWRVAPYYSGRYINSAPSIEGCPTLPPEFILLDWLEYPVDPKGCKPSALLAE